MTQGANYGTSGLSPRHAAALPQSDAFNMEERKDPTFIQFGDGETVRGVLTNIERITVNEKPCLRYTVEDLDSRELSSFLGTYQINTKLRKDDIGHVIEVRCEGVDKTVRRGANNMKIFKVQVSSQTAPGWANDGTPVTNADIGF